MLDNFVISNPFYLIFSVTDHWEPRILGSQSPTGITAHGPISDV